MAEEVKRYLRQLTAGIDGLYAVVITDRDGVPIVKVATENAPELATRPHFLSTFGLVTEQASKLGLGKNDTIVSMFTSYQVVQMRRHPFLITAVANNIANTGLLLSLDEDLKDVLQDLRSVLPVSS